MTKNDILNYIMTTPKNTNRAVLESILGSGDWSKLFKYVENTPGNMNRMVLEGLLSALDGAFVGTAIVGTAVI